MHYDMEDLIEQANEVQESMSRTYGVPDEVDEADLEAGAFPHLPSFRSSPFALLALLLFLSVRRAVPPPPSPLYSFLIPLLLPCSPHTSQSSTPWATTSPKKSKVSLPTCAKTRRASCLTLWTSRPWRKRCVLLPLLLLPCYALMNKGTGADESLRTSCRLRRNGWEKVSYEETDVVAVDSSDVLASATLVFRSSTSPVRCSRDGEEGGDAEGRGGEGKLHRLLKKPPLLRCRPRRASPFRCGEGGESEEGTSGEKVEGVEVDEEEKSQYECRGGEGKRNAQLN